MSVSVTAAADAPFVFGGFDGFQFRDGFGGDERGKFFETLGDFEAEFGGAGDEAGVGMFAFQSEQFGERSGAEEFFAGELIFGADREGRSDFFKRSAKMSSLVSV